jgi:hypothetical protein
MHPSAVAINIVYETGELKEVEVAKQSQLRINSSVY